MTSAPKHAISPAFAHADARERGHAWERILAVLIVCLPVPLLAATGLTIPLPAGVERIGAALVAWTDDGPAASPLGESGAIVLAGSEEAAPESPTSVGVSLHRSTGLPGLETTNPADGAKPAKEQNEGSGGAGGGGGASDGGGGGAGGAGGGGGGGGGGSGPPDPGDGDPGDDPGLVEGTVKEVVETTEPVVEEAESTLDDLLPTDDLLPRLGE
jgi:uncharacterized membrane protein YgcG